MGETYVLVDGVMVEKSALKRRRSLFRRFLRRVAAALDVRVERIPIDAETRRVLQEGDGLVLTRRLRTLTEPDPLLSLKVVEKDGTYGD